MERIYLIGIIILLSFVIFFICNSNSSRSTFGAESTSILPTVSKDTTLIFYAPWCGHCKNNMKYFKEAVDGGDGKIVLIDATEVTGKELADKHDVKGFPTIMKGDGTVYNGERKDVDGIIEFSKS
jgi:thiol-disulfide isomerase/thioredoxin